MGKKFINEQEAAELQGEGGSDVFTTTRHINYNQPETKVRYLIVLNVKQLIDLEKSIFPDKY